MKLDLQAINSRCDKVSTYNKVYTCDDLINSVNDIPKLLKYIEKLEAERMNWISINDKLPEEGIQIIIFGVQDGIKFIEGGYAWFGDFFCDDYDDHIPLKDVTHWMPLPKFPTDYRVANSYPFFMQHDHAL